MGKKVTPEEIKSLELDILDHISKICKENDIKYSLAYGTLLGAVRHNGFIPWDDDIDIYMYRPDYDRFISQFKENERFDLLSVRTDSTYYYEFSKVVDKRTSVRTTNARKIGREGVWVDIFPLDDVGHLSKVKKKIIDFVVGCRILSINLKFPSQKRSVLLYPLWLVCKIIGPKFFLAISDYLSRSGADTGEVGYMCSLWMLNFSFPKKWIEDFVVLSFEDRVYTAIGNYDGYLRSQYGDYMQLPPPEKRIIHPVEAYWR